MLNLSFRKLLCQCSSRNYSFIYLLAEEGSKGKRTREKGYVYVYMCIHMCMRCVCVCVWKKERGSERLREISKDTRMKKRFEKKRIVKKTSVSKNVPLTM